MFSRIKEDISDINYDRVRRHTPSWMNRRIDDQTEQNIQQYQNLSQSEIAQRIGELDREWDIERVLEFNASALALTGLVLGLTRNRKWLMVPSVVLPFLLQHSVQGWCPPLPLFRAMGVRTRKEIDKEKFSIQDV